MKYHNVTLKDYISNGIHTLNREELKKWIKDEALDLIEFHPSNRPKDLDENSKLASLYRTPPSINLVLCAESAEAIPVLEETLSEIGIKLVRVDCRSFADRNSMVSYIAQETQFSHNGSFKWSPVVVGGLESCDTSIPWDFILLFDHVEAFDPIDEEENYNSNLRFCLGTVVSILKNDSHHKPPTIAIVSPTTSFSGEFFEELYKRSYASKFILSEQ